MRANLPSPSRRPGLATPSLKLLRPTDPALPAADARHVVALLKKGNVQPSQDLNEVRARYAASRKPLLAPLQPVARVVEIASPAPGVPPLTIFRPSGAPDNAALPALLWLHGGGWTVGSLETYEPFCRQLANATGHAVVWVEYRLAPEHPFPAPFHDAVAAYDWVSRNHQVLQLDRARICVGGDSAGGNLAAALSIAAREQRKISIPAAQVLVYPCLDMLACLPSHKELADGPLLTAPLYAWYRKNYLGGHDQPSHWRLSPITLHSAHGLPPTVILYAGFDPLRDEAEVYADKLLDADVPLELLYFPDMIHGFITMGGAIAAAGAAIERIAVAMDALAQQSGE
jgi:acetyl esterase